MNKLYVILAIIAASFSQNTFAQDNAKPQLINAYYTLKEALVSSNATSASTSADELVNAINNADKQTINDDAREALLKDAKAVSQSKDLKQQRIKFATLSSNMFELAKKVKLSPDPVYQQYCPMAKASWLSANKAIKNPYYGSAMLTCGTVQTVL
jgi:archaellum component FlaF (FlaF/FlaG flagellin family)